MRKILNIIFLLLLFLIFSFGLAGEAKASTWVSPITGNIAIECWGGGGAGGGQNQNTDGGGGGGGGAYAKVNTYAVTKGTSYDYTTGSGGTGVASSKGNDGGTSTFASVCVALGGTGGSPSTGTPPVGGAGGVGASGTGDTLFSGGQGEKGRDFSTGTGGYGGSSAGTAADGYSGPQTWSTLTYPTASTPTGGGHGGDGGSANNNGSAPASGSGGGGGGSGEGTAMVGGAGSGGQIVLWFESNTAPTVVLNTPDDASSGSDATPTLNFTGTDALYLDDIEYNVQVANNAFTTFSTITRDAVSSASTNPDSNTLAFSHTVGNFSNRMLIVGVELRGAKSVNSITYGAVSLRRINYNQPGADNRTELWYVASPVVGTDTITITASASTTIAAGAISFYNVDSTIGGTANGGSDGTGTSSSIAISSETSSLVVDVIGLQSNNSTLAADASQTQEIKKVGTADVVGMSTKAGATSISMVWTFTTDRWSGVAVNLKPSATTILDKFSVISDAGFTAGHPFASGTAVDYTVQAGEALAPGTYYWRVKGKDPSGTNTYGAWSSIRSFTITSSSGPIKVVFTNTGRTLTAGACNGDTDVLTIQLQDIGSTPTNPTGTTVINVTSNSPSETVYSDNGCTSATNDFTFTTAQNTKSVYIKDTRKSNPTWTLTATKTSGPDTIADGTQSITINAGSVSRLVVTLPSQSFTDGVGNSGSVINQTAGIISFSTITRDAVSSAATNPDSNTLAFSHTIGNFSNRMLIVGVELRGGKSVNSMTYGAASLTLINSNQPAADNHTELWYVASPVVGTDTITITASASTTMAAGAISFYNVDSTIGGNATGGSNVDGTSSSITISSETNSLVVDVVGLQSVNSTLAAHASQTQEIKKVGTADVVGMSTKAGATSISMVWTFTTDRWSGVAVNLKPSGIIISATDNYFNVNTGYSGAKTIGYAGPGNAPDSTPPSYTTSVSFTSGQSTTTLATTLYKAETTTITATDGGLYGYASSSLTVDAGALNNYQVVAATPQTAGVCFTGTNTVTARDQWNNTRTQDASVVNMTTTGTSVTFYTTSACATSTTQYTISSGQATMYIKTPKKQSGFTVTATRNGFSETGTSGAITVDPGLASAILVKLPGQTFTDGTGISGSPSFTGLRTPNATAGTSYTVDVKAVDANNNLVNSGSNNYTGAKTISFADSVAGNAPNSQAPSFPGSPVTFANGEANALSVTYYNAATGRTVEADDTATPVAGTASTTFTVQAGSENNYGVSAGTPQTAGVAFNVTVTARDSWNNSLGSLYSAPAGTYIWTTTAGNAPDTTAPSIGTLIAGNFASGVATKSVTLYKAESGVTFTAGEPSPSTVTGTSGGVTESPGSISADLNDSTVTGDASVSTDTNSTITITLKDTWRNPKSSVPAADIVLSATPTETVTQPSSPTDASGVTTGQIKWSNTGEKTVTVTIQTSTLVQNDGSTPDADGKLDDTHTITVVVSANVVKIKGGIKLRSGMLLGQ